MTVTAWPCVSALAINELPPAKVISLLVRGIAGGAAVASRSLAPIGKLPTLESPFTLKTLKDPVASERLACSDSH